MSPLINDENQTTNAPACTKSEHANNGPSPKPRRGRPPGAKNKPKSPVVQIPADIGETWCGLYVDALVTTKDFLGPGKPIPYGYTLWNRMVATGAAPQPFSPHGREGKSGPTSKRTWLVRSLRDFVKGEPGTPLLSMAS